MTIYLPIVSLIIFCSFQILAIRNNAAMDIIVLYMLYICIHIVVHIISVIYIPKSGIAGIYNIYMFHEVVVSFSRHCQTIFQNGSVS